MCISERFMLAIAAASQVASSSSLPSKASVRKGNNSLISILVSGVSGMYLRVGYK